MCIFICLHCTYRFKRYAWCKDRDNFQTCTKTWHSIETKSCPICYHKHTKDSCPFCISGNYNEDDEDYDEKKISLQRYQDEDDEDNNNDNAEPTYCNHCDNYSKLRCLSCNQKNCFVHSIKCDRCKDSYLCPNCIKVVWYKDCDEKQQSLCYKCLKKKTLEMIMAFHVQETPKEKIETRDDKTKKLRTETSVV